MYSNTTLYYLNQLGIRPWIKREDSLCRAEISTMSELVAAKLLVFISSALSDKAQLLLRQMMNYIGLNDEEQRIILLQGCDSLNHYRAKVEQENPLAILILGLNELQVIQDWHFSGAVLHSFDPDHLLLNPAAKKTVFKDLTYIKQLISIS